MYRSYSKFVFQSSKINYSVYGEGENALVMFHGFGHTHKNMREIEEALASEYKIYSFDLFFHGLSEWNKEDQALTKEYWKELFGQFLLENKIERFGLLGFSLGGKVALATAECFADRINKMYLIAPDGLKLNFWYKIVTLRPLKGIFRHVIMDPTIFEYLLRALRKFALLDKSSARFAAIQMNSREKRRRVYYTWTVFKGLRLDTEFLVGKINENAINVEFYLGEFDKIIPVKTIKNFAERLNNKKIVVLKSGHNNLLDEVAYNLESALEKR